MYSRGRMDQFPNLTITNRSRVRQTARRFGATHLVSLFDPGTPAYRPSRVRPADHLRLIFYDLEQADAYGGPKRSDIEAILSFGRRLDLTARVAVACEAGRSRSTAAAFLLLVQRFGFSRACAALEHVYAVRPSASPNLLMVELGDQILGAEGRLVSLVEEARKRPRPLVAVADGKYSGSEE
jgi:predicted protein tyrosine phosphatase